MQQTIPLYNVLCTYSDGTLSTMLGTNVPWDEAERWCQKYTDNLPNINRGREANGFPPLLCTYEVTEAAGKYQPWFPSELRDR